MNGTAYANRVEALERVVVPRLDQPFDRYDFDEIFAEVFVFDETRGGWVQYADNDEFWTIIAKHER